MVLLHQHHLVTNDALCSGHLDNSTHRDRPNQTMLERQLAQAGVAIPPGPCQTGFVTSKGRRTWNSPRGLSHEEEPRGKAHQPLKTDFKYSL